MFGSNVKYVLMLLALMSQMAAAGELFNVGLRVDLKYDSFGESCRLHALYRHYNLSAEIHDDVVERAQLTKIKMSESQKVFALTSDEMLALDIRHDQGYSWLKSIAIGPDLLRVIIRTADGLSKSECKLPHDVIIENDDHIVFDFGVEKVEYLLPHLMDSNSVKIRGRKENGDPVLMTLTLTQDRT